MMLLKALLKLHPILDEIASRHLIIQLPRGIGMLRGPLQPKALHLLRLLGYC